MPEPLHPTGAPVARPPGAGAGVPRVLEPHAGWSVPFAAVAAAALLTVGARSFALAVAAWAAVGTGLYLLAAAMLVHRGLREACRGALLGLNAGMNAVAWTVLWPSADLAAGEGMGAAALALNLAAGFTRVARAPRFQTALGYANWLLPASWPVLGAGWLMFLSSLLGSALLRSPFFRVRAAWLHARTGTVFLRGGFVANLNPVRTAFDMGPFAFVHQGSPSAFEAHEAGHTLNLAAFGSVFHLVGAFDENVLGAGARALAERLAESHVGTKASGPTWRMWG